MHPAVHPSPPPARAHRPTARRVVTALVAAALAVVGLAPAQAATGDGSSFRSPLPLPLTALDGTFSASNTGLITVGTRDILRLPLFDSGRWYEFTSPVSTRIVFTNDATFDSTLELWTADGRYVGHNDDSLEHGANAQLTANLVAGTTYRLAFGSFSRSHTGSGTVTVRPTAAPAAPTSMSVAPGDRSATVSWTPATTGGPVAGYVLTCSYGDTTRVCGEPSPDATSATFTGLTNGVPVTVELAASNSVGTARTSASATPRATSTLTWAVTPAAPVSAEPVTLTVQATASDGSTPTGTVQVEVGDASFPLTLASGTASVELEDGLPAGTHTVTTAYAGSATVTATSTSGDLVVARRPQTVTLAPVGPLTYGDVPLTVSATASSLGRPVTLVTTGACTLDGTTVTATDVGTCTVVASEPGTADIEAATPVAVDVEVARRPQTVTIDAIGDLRFAVEPVRVVATSSVGLPVTLTATGACVVDGDELRTIASGDCTVTASQPGDAHTLPAADASTTVRVVGPGTSADVSLDAQLGDLAAGAPFSVRGGGLLPGSQVVVTVHSTPRELARVTVGAAGTALVTGVLPAGLEVGAHRLVVEADGLDGVAVAAEVRFEVAADGTLVRIGDSVLRRPAAPAPAAPAAAAAAPALAVTGAGSATVGALALAWLLLGAALVTWRRRATA